MKALAIATDGFEDVELNYPYYRLIEEDITVEVATPDSEEIFGKHETHYEADKAIKKSKSENYNLLIIPGGNSPENLRIEAPESVDLVKEFYEQDRIIAAICHGPQLLMSADILRNKEATCYWSIRDDLENAGAIFLDEGVVVDENLITSRHPDDLPAFMKKIIEEI